jgi:protease IV
MALNADTLLDRIYLKNQARRWRMIALLVGLVSALLLSQRYGGFEEKFAGDHIARYTLDEVIYDDSRREDLLKEIEENDSIKALVLRVDSPGGTTVASEEIYLALRDIAKKKPVVCVMRSYATSGGYLAAIGADYIVAREGTLTGSIGVIMQSAEVSELVQKLGIKPFTIRSGALKGSPTPLERFTEKEATMLQGLIQDFYHYFIDLVKKRRKLTDEQVAAIADGRVVSARNAVKLNLIDAIGGEQEALAWLEKEHKIDTSLEIKDVKVKEEKPSLGNLLEHYSSRFFLDSLLVRLDGLVSIWQPAALR